MRNIFIYFVASKYEKNGKYGDYKDAGLKITPQRKVVYEVMMELRHAAIDEIIKCVQSKDNQITISTIYRILDSFCKANLLSLVFHPEEGKIYYDLSFGS